MTLPMTWRGSPLPVSPLILVHQGAVGCCSTHFLRRSSTKSSTPLSISRAFSESTSLWPPLARCAMRTCDATRSPSAVRAISQKKAIGGTGLDKPSGLSEPLLLGSFGFIGFFLSPDGNAVYRNPWLCYKPRAKKYTDC